MSTCEKKLRKKKISVVFMVLIGDKVQLFQAIYRPLDMLCYETMEKRLQRMLVTHSVCAGACWYGSSPGAVPATGTAAGWAAHPTQRKTQRTKGMTYRNTHTHTQKHANTENTLTGTNTLLMSMDSPINTANKNTHGRHAHIH